MKTIVIVFLLIILGILFIIFRKPVFATAFQVADVAKDTTFQNPIWDAPDEYARHVSLSAIGEIDDSTEVFLNDPDYPNQFIVAQLPKGKFDTTWIGEYYEKKAEVVFLHKKAKKGNVKIIFHILTSNLDTLNSSR